MSDNADIQTGLRALLLLWEEVTDLCDDRIRPDAPTAIDGNETHLSIELSDGVQNNVLEREVAFIQATVVLRIRSTDASECKALAEAIRSRNAVPSVGLDGYQGPAGDCDIVECQRTGFSFSKVYDDDGDETDLHESLQVYDVWYLIGG